MFRLILILCFTLAGISNAQASESSVEVVSDYRATNGKIITIKGTGVYVTAQSGRQPPRHFVLSVAHITGGENLRIKVAGQPTTILRYASLSRKDLFLAEIAAPTAAKPIATWDQKRGIYTNVFVQTSKNRLKSKFSGLEIQTFSIGNDKGDSLYRTNQNPNGLGFDFSDVPPFIALPADYKNPRATGFQQLDGEMVRSVVYNIVDQIVFRASIAPGMSGSPLFFVMGVNGSEKEYYLAGLASQYSIRAQRSFATRIDSYAPLFTHLTRAKSSGELTEKLSDQSYRTRWVHSGSRTLREIYDANSNELVVRESSLDLPAGDGTNGDGGDGTNGDGGDGTNGDGGDGTNGDGGDGTNGDGGDGTNGDGGLAKTCARPVAVTPSLYFRGRTPKFFFIRKKSDPSGRGGFAIHANYASVNFILENEKSLIVDSIVDTSKVPTLFKVRVDFMGLRNSLGLGAQETYVAQDASSITFEYHLDKSRVRSDLFDVRVTDRGLTSGNSSAAWTDKYLVLKSSRTNRSYLLDVQDLVSVNLELLSEKDYWGRPGDKMWHIYRFFNGPNFFIYPQNKSQGCK